MAPDYKCMYQYVLVRKDMPKVYHIIQTAHAVQEATIAFGVQCHDLDYGTYGHGLPIHLILLEVNNEAQLNDADHIIQAAGVQTRMFHEPDYDSGFTALAVELLNDDDPRREIFKQFRMYR